MVLMGFEPVLLDVVPHVVKCQNFMFSVLLWIASTVLRPFLQGFGGTLSPEPIVGRWQVVCIQVRGGHPPKGRRQCILRIEQATAAFAASLVLRVIPT